MNHLCKDCSVDTASIELYMVHDLIWAVYGGGRGMLCIACLESRMERQLKPGDFTDFPINRGNLPQSPRLKRRCGEGTHCQILPSYYEDLLWRKATQSS
jgi:hypothetical protein